jgi:sirohydrochlorin ferrochelatase
LLFPGQLYDEIVTAVANCRAAHPSREWLVVEPLGCDSLVSIAIWDRVRESGVV